MSHLNDCEKISRRYTGKMDKGKSDEQSASSSEAQAKRESPNLLEDNPGEDLIESSPDSMAEETPNIMIFREVAKISNRVGDMYELPAFGGSGEKCVIVNFDFDICGYTGECISFSFVFINTADRILTRQIKIMN